MGSCFRECWRPIWMMVGLPFNSSIHVIEETRRKLLLKWHPDKNPHDIRHANEVVKIINAGFEKWVEQRRGKTESSAGLSEIAREWQRLSEAQKRGDQIWKMVGLIFSSRIKVIKETRDKLLLQWHPDKHPNDVPHANKIVAFINTSFDAWLEERRRRQRRPSASASDD